MIKSEMIRARINPVLKNEVDNIFKELGLTTTEAIILFYNQVRLYKGLPFDVKIPNNETILAIQNMEENINITTCNTMDDFKKD